MADPKRRVGEALDAIGARERVSDRLRRVRLTLLPIVQSAVGAALAWWVASGPLIGHDQPFFAPIAALISLGVGIGQRLTRVLELVVGVALGVLVADTLIGVIGAGVLQIALVVGLAMVVAVFLGGGPVSVAQAASSAALVATLVPPRPGEIVNFERFVDASVGGLVGLIVSALLLPVNPVAAARRQIDPLLNTAADLMDDLAVAVAGRDRSAATQALATARGTQAAVDDMHTALEGSAEVARMAPVRWHARGQLVGYIDAATPVDYLVRDLRVLARHAVAALRRNEPIPVEVGQSLRALAGAVRLLRIDLSSGDLPREAQASAIAAAEIATEALEHTGGFSSQVVVAQVRSLAVDVLLASGLERDEALRYIPSPP